MEGDTTTELSTDASFDDSVTSHDATLDDSATSQYATHDDSAASQYAILDDSASSHDATFDDSATRHDATLDDSATSDDSTISNERNSITILWRIEQFRTWQYDCDGKEIKSPVFTSHLLEGNCFQFYLYKAGPCHINQDLWLYFIRNCGEFDFPVDCEIAFLSAYTPPLVFGYGKIHAIGENILNINISSKEENDIFMKNGSSFLPRGILTIRCRIWKNLGDFTETELISLRTKIETVENDFLWHIPEFSALELNQEVTTPIKFDYLTLTNDFLLKFSLKGESLEKAVACLELVAVSIRSIAPRAFLRVFVLGKKEKSVKAVKMAPKYHYYMESKGSTSIPKLEIPIAEIATRKELVRNVTLFRNDVLTLLCKISSVRVTSVID